MKQGKARCIVVIEVYVRKGTGAPDDPFRAVIQYCDLDGSLLAETDHNDDGDWHDLNGPIRRYPAQG